MVPNVNARGTSFKGVTAYLMHDKENPKSSERMAWSATRNMITDDIELAAKIMAFTDMHSEDIKQDFGGSVAGTKREAGAVYHFSLSESPHNNPSQEEWERYVEQNIKILGLEDHQYYMVAHNDEPHAHVHVVVNLVHPETGKINSLHNDFKKMDKLAHEYELEHGIVCEERNKKYQAWEQDKKAFKEKERRAEYAEKVTTAFEQSDNAQSFKAALEYEGLTLAQGNRRGFVLVDEQGEIYALNRLIKFSDDIKRKEKNTAIKNKLGNIDKDTLPIATQLQEDRQFIDRDAIEVEQQHKLLDAAEKSASEQIKADKIAEEKAKALLLKIKRYQKQKADFDRQEKYSLIQYFIDQKIKASRQKWGIKALKKQRENLRKDLVLNSGFIARMTGKHREAIERLEAHQKTLNERLLRFRCDIVYFNRNRPQWLLKKELKKYGFKPELSEKEKTERTIIHEQIRRYKEIKAAIEQSNQTTAQENNPLPETLKDSFGRYVEQSAKGELEPAQAPNLSQSFIESVDHMAKGMEEEEEHNALDRRQEL